MGKFCIPSNYSTVHKSDIEHKKFGGLETNHKFMNLFPTIKSIYWGTHCCFLLLARKRCWNHNHLFEVRYCGCFKVPTVINQLKKNTYLKLQIYSTSPPPPPPPQPIKSVPHPTPLSHFSMMAITAVPV